MCEVELDWLVLGLVYCCRMVHPARLPGYHKGAYDCVPVVLKHMLFGALVAEPSPDCWASEIHGPYVAGTKVDMSGVRMIYCPFGCQRIECHDRGRRKQVGVKAQIPRAPPTEFTDDVVGRKVQACREQEHKVPIIHPSGPLLFRGHPFLSSDAVRRRSLQGECQSFDFARGRTSHRIRNLEAAGLRPSLSAIRFTGQFSRESGRACGSLFGVATHSSTLSRCGFSPALNPGARFIGVHRASPVHLHDWRSADRCNGAHRKQPPIPCRLGLSLSLRKWYLTFSIRGIRPCR